MKRKFKKYLKLATLIISLLILYKLTPLQEDITYNSLQNDSLNNLNEITRIENENFVKVLVSRIVDGDTIEIIMNSEKYKVRFIGVNCPEYTSKIEEYGKEATEYTKNALFNKYVYIEKDVSETDKYGRLLRYIWLDIPTSITENEIRTKMFNAKLLIDGYAQVSTYPPDVKYVDYFKSLQREAKNNNVGLWNKK